MQVLVSEESDKWSSTEICAVQHT